MATDHFPTFRKIDERLRAVRWSSWPFTTVRQAWFPTFAPWFWSLLGRGGVTRAQRRALLRLIQVAAEEPTPLAPLVVAWAQEEPLMQRKRLLRLSRVLAEGVPVADAVERFPSLLSDEEILLVRFASESGTLAVSLRQHLKAATDESAPVRENLRRSKRYLLMMVLIGLPVVLWVTLYITPALEAIHSDFETVGFDFSSFRSLQKVQIFVLDWLIPISLVVLAVFVAGRWLKGPWRSFRRRVAPLLFGSVRSLRVAQVLRRLSETCRAGRPLDGAVSTLARSHYDPALRHKLLFARNELALGAGLWPSFQTVGLLSAKERRALDAGDRLGVTGWTLAALADAKERRAIRWQSWLSMALWLATVLLFGAFVLIQAIGMISFLSELITSIA